MGDVEIPVIKLNFAALRHQKRSFGHNSLRRIYSNLLIFYLHSYWSLIRNRFWKFEKNGGDNDSINQNETEMKQEVMYCCVFFKGWYNPRLYFYCIWWL